MYFESSATAPYQIRRIDELNKTPTGAVEAKVACYFRRRDVSIALINQAEKYYVSDIDSDEECPDGSGKSSGTPNGSAKRSHVSVSDVDKHRIKHRELFLSRQIECLPATHIRGKCSVTLYNDVEPLTNYLKREDAFYYKLIYDPSLKTLQEDRGSMRIGSDHQSEIQSFLKDPSTDPRLNAQLEELVWKPDSITDEEVDMFCLLVRAVGTLGRAYDPNSATRQPVLLGAAAAAGRDITKQHAHDLLHKANYDLRKAISLLLPGNQPVICRDQLEEWSPSEAQLFEEALDKYSKTFSEIQAESLPWKTHKSLVELYYFWKTTDRYVRQRRTKLAAQEHKLKQVYIPNYSKPNPAVLYNGSDKAGRGCEGCAATSSSQWYAWGPSNLLYRLCSSCWTYWKRYGGLKNLAPKGSASHSGGRPCPEQRAQERAASSRNAPSAHGLSHELDCKATGPASSGAHTTASFSSQSAEAPRPAHHVTPFLVGINPTGARANHTPGSGLSIANPNASRYADGLGLPAALAGAPRGTQCSKTAAVVKLARILCPNLIRPLRLARRPGRHAGSTALQTSTTVANKEAESMDQAVSLDALCVAARPIISRLPNPSALLFRPRRMPPLDDVIKSVAKRKGITLSTQDLTSIVLGVTNGSVPSTGSKRTRPLAASVVPSDNSVNAVDLVNGAIESVTGNSGASSPASSTALGGIGPDGDASPPPCKKQLLSESAHPSARTELSNGLMIVTDDDHV